MIIRGWKPFHLIITNLWAYMEYDDDKERLIRLSLGDHEAFQILFTRYQPELKKYIAFITKSEVAAEDIVQDIFIKIWIFREQMAAINSLRAYIFHIGKNAAFDYLRWYAVQRDYRAHLKPEPRISQVEAHYFASEIENHVRMLVRKMPRQWYTVFLMSRRDGLNYREIAHTLNISHKTVANHLHLALCEIKHELDELYV